MNDNPPSPSPVNDKPRDPLGALRHNLGNLPDDMPAEVVITTGRAPKHIPGPSQVVVVKGRAAPAENTLEPTEAAPLVDAPRIFPSHPMPAPQFRNRIAEGLPRRSPPPGLVMGPPATVRRAMAKTVPDERVIEWVKAEGPLVSLARLAGLLGVSDHTMRQQVQRCPALELDREERVSLRR